MCYLARTRAIMSARFRFILTTTISSRNKRICIHIQPVNCLARVMRVSRWRLAKPHGAWELNQPDARIKFMRLPCATFETGGGGEGSPKTTVTSLLNCWLHIFWCESNTRWGPDKRTCYVLRYSNLNETRIKVELRFAGRIKAHLRCGNSKFHGEVAPRDVIIFVLGCIKRIYPVEKRKVSRARNNWAHCRLTMNISLNYSTPILIFDSRISNVLFHFFFFY